MADVPLADRVAAMGSAALPRRSAVAQWMRAKWDELEKLGPGLRLRWSAVVAMMEADGVEGATALQARQTYWRLKTSPQPWRAEAFSWDGARPVAALVEEPPRKPERRKLGRVGDKR